VNPEWKEMSMKTSISKTKRAQVPASQQAHDIPRPKPVPTAKHSLGDIAKRAYEIYLEKGCQPGQSEQNWKQAEQELTKGLKIVSA
jgi:hypothetical protein